MQRGQPVFFLKLEDSPNITEAIKLAQDNGMHGVMTTVVNSQYIREHIDESIAANQACFSRSPMILSSHSWVEEVIPIVTPPNLSIDDEELKLNNERKFLQELNFALHLSMHGTVNINLANNDVEAIGELVKRCLKSSNLHEGKVTAEIPMTDYSMYSNAFREDVPEDETSTGQDTWQLWQKFYAATGHHKKVELALVMTPDLPSDEEIKRWLGEKISILVVPHSCFLSNNKNFPVLSKKHQAVLYHFLLYTKCTIVIEPQGCGDRRIKSFVDFIRHVWKISYTENYNTTQEDNLRYPLQPLHDNLDTSTYETFEADPAKYILYQKAIEQALLDMVPDSEKETKRLVLMVVGAGRGPLIRASLNASKNTGRKLKILAVEKNPNAIVTLTALINVLWANEDVTLLSKDMRTLVLDEKADIIVSELLGSIGDNELSPECLDGVQNLLKPEGISIPYNSTSYLRPVMNPKVYNKILQHYGFAESKLYSLPKEVSWLVYLSNVYYIDEPKELFKFVHPNHDDPIDNSRHTKLEFKAELDCVLHGFAGYFTSKLYKDIEISIHPYSHSQGMGSWYPAYFPVLNPHYIKKGEKISIEMWRKIEPNVKVWYEWSAQNDRISNKGGEIHPILM